jgi:Cu/Ag efflux pump CusA
MADLRQRVETQVPGLQIELLQLMEDLIGDLTAVPQPIEVKLFGADLRTLRSTAARVAMTLQKLPGLVEVRDGQRVSGDALEVRVDKARAAYDGLDAAGVAQQLTALLGGSVITQVQSGEKLLDVRIWSPLMLRDRIESLRKMLLRTPDGHLLPLSRVADVTIRVGQPQITREDLEQMVPVTARLENRDLGSAMKDVRRTWQCICRPPCELSTVGCMPNSSDRLRVWRPCLALRCCWSSLCCCFSMNVGSLLRRSWPRCCCRLRPYSSVCG